MAVIIDLDLTLVDSSSALHLRRQRRWSDVYRAIASFSMYHGVRELLSALNERDVPVCIVTSSPRSYCERVLQHFDITCASSVCYHDTRQHKPHPAPILLALQRLGVHAERAVSIGDEPRDIVASRAADVTAIAALWGASDPSTLLATEPDAAFETPGELQSHLCSLFRGS